MDWPGWSVVCAGLILIERGRDGRSVMDDCASFDGSAKLMAVTSIVWSVSTFTGAVYRPSAIVPTAGESDQLTPALSDPAIDGVNFTEFPELTDTDEGVRAIATAEVSQTVALAVLDESA